MSNLSRADIHALLKSRLWSVAALADRWGISRRYLTARIANEMRGNLWNDAFRGLETGPGFYRKNASALEDPQASLLMIGSLVASEADMDTFGYGSRGVVVDVLGLKEWLVVWDGGTVMEIDDDCMKDWVVDLGLRTRNQSFFSATTREIRIEVAKMMNLYG